MKRTLLAAALALAGLVAAATATAHDRYDYTYDRGWGPYRHHHHYWRPGWGYRGYSPPPPAYRVPHRHVGPHADYALPSPPAIHAPVPSYPRFHAHN